MSFAPHLQQIRALARLAKGYRWAIPVIAGLALSASFAESLAISLVVLFLYTAIGPGVEAMGFGNGLLSRIFEAGSALAGDGPIALGALVIVFMVAKVGLSVGHSLISSVIKNVITERARNEIYAQYMNVSFDYIQQKSRGDLVNILSNESWKLADVFHYFTRIVANIGAMIVFSAMLIAISWEITLIAGIGSAILFVILRWLSVPTRQLGALAMEANNRLAKHMVNSLYGMRAIRAYAQEGFRQRLFENVSREARGALVKLDVIQTAITPLAELSYLAVLAAIVWMSMVWEIPFATTLTAVALLYRLQPHLREFERNRLHLAQLAAPIAAVESILRRSDKSYPPQGQREFHAMSEGIEFAQVSFAYPGTEDRSLRNASFFVPAGATTALVGRSGAGKTTIVNLLLRLYEPGCGSVLLDGQPLVSFDRGSWLKRIAVAGQDVELVEDTILENIRLSRHDATPAQIHNAAELAGIADFIAGLPDGYHSCIGEHGLKLSGGQRQRIGLARALLREPDLLILDEATNAVDNHLEDEIRDNIAHAMSGRTLLIITHRLESLQRADHVISLEKGRVISQGSPQALLALRNGRWYHAPPRQVH